LDCNKALDTQRLCIYSENATGLLLKKSEKILREKTL